METVKVFDTWVEAPGTRLHFDVMTSDEQTAIRLANEHVAALGHPAVTVTAQECQFCHQEPLAMFAEEQQRAYRQAGGFIVSLSS